MRSIAALRSFGAAVLTGPPAPVGLGQARYLSLAPIAIGEVIGSLEALSSLREYRDDGLLGGRTRFHSTSRIPRWFRRVLDAPESVAALRGVSIAGSAIILASPRSRGPQIVGSSIVLLANALTEYRNPFGRDGSDQMAQVITGYRVATAVVPDSNKADDLYLRAVNMQVFLSYLASGLAKVVSSSWRSGEALRMILEPRQYGRSWPARKLKEYPNVARWITRGTFVWESSFPLVYLLSPGRARKALMLVRGFHFVVAATMGLPRFFWGFSSSHAAAIYVIDHGGRGVAK